MKSKDILIGHTYAAKVSGKIQHVRIQGMSTCGAGWRAVNVATGREIAIRGGKRIRYEVKPGVDQVEGEAHAE